MLNWTRIEVVSNAFFDGTILEEEFLLSSKITTNSVRRFLGSSRHVPHNVSEMLVTLSATLSKTI